MKPKAGFWLSLVIVLGAWFLVWGVDGGLARIVSSAPSAVAVHPQVAPPDNSVHRSGANRLTKRLSEKEESDSRFVSRPPGLAAPMPFRALRPLLDQTVSGVITESTTWTTGNVYTLTSDVIITRGVVLTIEPGVIVKGAASAELRVLGHLRAVGAPSDWITFTSSTDSGPDQWQGLVFDGGTGDLQHVVVRYGGNLNSILSEASLSNPGSNIAVRNVLTGEVRLDACQVMTAGAFYNGSRTDYGLYVENSHVVVSGTVFRGNGDTDADYALYAKGASTMVTVTGSEFRDNGGWATRVEAHGVQRITDNTFTNNTYNRVLVAGGTLTTGAQLTKQTGLEAYELASDVTVPEAVTLTVASGVLVMGRSSAELRVLGHLQAVGLLVTGVVTEPIIFTSAGNSGPDQWQGLVFDGGTGYLRHVVVRYGGNLNSVLNEGNAANPGSNIAMRNVLTGEVRLDACRLIAGRALYNGSRTDYGLYVENSHVVVSGTLFSGNGDTDADYALYATGADTVLTVTDSEFRDNGGWAARVPADDAHRLTGNVFSGNLYDRVLIAGGAVVDGARLTAQDGLQGYELAGDVTVPTETVLTVSPGVTVMGRSEVELRVLGHLQAVGTSTEMITFTSSANTGPYQWSGLVFDGGTGDLQYTTVRYAGHRNSVLTNYFPASNITIRDVLTGEVRLEHSRVLSTYNDYGGMSRADYGVYVENSNAVISGTLFSQNGDTSDDYALYAKGVNTVITVTGSEFRDNGGWAMRVPLDDAHRITGNVFSGNGFNRVLLSGGPVPGDVTWTAQEGLQSYELAGDARVPTETVLTVAPGVMVMGRTNVELLVLGHLQAYGTSGQLITFTSSANTAPYQWSGLVFDGGTGVLRHATVRYGGQGNSVWPSLPGSNILARNVLTGELRLDHSQVISGYNYYGNYHRQDYGLYIENSHVVISDTLFSQNGNNTEDFALYATGAQSLITLTNCTVQNNPGWGVYTANDVTLWVSDTEFMDNGYYPLRTEAFNLQRVLAGNVFSGNGVNRVLTRGTLAHDVTFTTQPGFSQFELDGDMTVPTDTVLTVSPGVMVMGRGNVELRVIGHLQAVGDPAHPITFTSATNTGPNQWSGLVFDGGTGDIRYATVRYSGMSNSVLGSFPGTSILARNVLTGEVRLEHSRVISGYNYYSNYHRQDYGLYVENSHMAVHDTLLAGHGGEGTDNATLYIVGADTVVTVTNSTFRDNFGTGIVMKTGQAMVTCVSLADYYNGVSFDGGVLTVLGSSITGSSNYAVVNTSSEFVDARYNWWGSDTGPWYSFVNPNGQGGKVSGNVHFDPWLDVPKCVVDLSITKRGFPDPVAMGETLTYTINVINDSFVAATAFTVTDVLPWNLTFKRAEVHASSAAQGTCAESGGQVTCPLTGLGRGEVATVTVVATAPLTTGMVSNLASVNGAEADPYSDDNAVKASTLGAPSDSADLSVVKTSEVIAGGHPMTYTLVVENNGPADATGVVLSDTLPSNIVFGSLTTSRGQCDGPTQGQLRCELGDLERWERVEIVIRATAPLTTGIIVNKASVMANEPDPRMANNADTVRDWVSGPQAICVPGVHDTWNGMTVTLKAIVRGGGPNLDYQWDFGDGFQTDVFTVSNRYAIETTHVYTGVLTDDLETPAADFIATLTVTDTDTGVRHQDIYQVTVREKTLEVQVNVAIDDALWYLHKQMERSTVDGVGIGYWPEGSSTTHVGYGGMATLAFEIQGHLLTGDYDENPYVETVERGVNYLLYKTQAEAIPVQPAGDPDSNGNGIGLATVASAGHIGYEAGIGLMALVDSGSYRKRAAIGPLEVRGRTYYDIAQDAVDWLAYAQTDTGVVRGGWRYTANLGADMSVTQWPVLAMEGAEVNWGISPPLWVKTELRDNFLAYAQSDTSGAFDYTAPGDDILLTGSGLVCLAFVDVPSSDPRVISATEFVANNWSQRDRNIGNFYGMYGIMKASRLTSPPIQFYGEHEWYKLYAEYLVAHQHTDGHWATEYGYGGVPIATAWGVLILSPRVFVGGADLALTKVDSADPVNPGELLTYTVTITNYGPAEATSIVLTDTLSAGAALAEVSPEEGQCVEYGDAQSGVRVQCNIERLASETGLAVTFVVTAPKRGTITNTVSVIGNELDPDTSNNDVVETTDVLCTCVPDTYEEDDGPSQAVTLTVGITQTHNFCEDTADWLIFNATQGMVYTITTSAWGTRADTVMALFASDAQTLLAFNDDASGTTDYSSRIVWLAQETGPLYVQVTNQGATTGCYNGYDVVLSTGEHRYYELYLPLVIRRVQPARSARGVLEPMGVISHTCPDAYETDDVWWQATLITDVVTQVHSFDSDPTQYVPDKDFVQVDLRAGESITFAVTAMTNTRTLMTLYDTNGAAIVGVTSTTVLTWRAPQAGQYYVGITPLTTTFGCTNTVRYHLSGEVLRLKELYLPLILLMNSD